MARITFPPEGTTQTSDEYRKLAKAGVIDTLSVGFIPHKWEPLKGGGLRYTDWECIELSLVSVPANPEAVVTARANKTDSDFRKAASARINALLRACGRGPSTSPSGRYLSETESKACRIEQLRREHTDDLLNSPRYRHLHRDKIAERVREIRARSSRGRP